MFQETIFLKDTQINIEKQKYFSFLKNFDALVELKNQFMGN
jgi:hypothetical protein